MPCLRINTFSENPALSVMTDTSNRGLAPRHPDCRSVRTAVRYPFRPEVLETDWQHFRLQTAG
jgi:hypothetical protein